MVDVVMNGACLDTDSHVELEASRTTHGAWSCAYHVKWYVNGRVVTMCDRARLVQRLHQHRVERCREQSASVPVMATCLTNNSGVSEYGPSDKRTSDSKQQDPHILS